MCYVKLFIYLVFCLCLSFHKFLLLYKRFYFLILSVFFFLPFLVVFLLAALFFRLVTVASFMLLSIRKENLKIHFSIVEKYFIKTKKIPFICRFVLTQWENEKKIKNKICIIKESKSITTPPSPPPTFKNK